MIAYSYTIPGLLLPLLHILIMKKLMKAFLGVGNNNFKTYIEWSIYYIFLVINTFDLIIPKQLLLTGNILLVFIINSSAYKRNLKQRCVFSLLICTVWMLIEIIVLLILTTIGFNGATLQNAGSFISKMCMLLLSVIISRCIKDNQYIEVSWRYFLIILLIPISSIYIMHHIFLIACKHKEYAAFSVTASFLFLLVNYVIFEIYDWISRDTELRELNRLYEQQLELCSQQAEEREKTYLEIRRIRHDLNNHFSGLLGMIRERQLTEAEDYIIGLLDDGIVTRPEEVSHSGNIIVDSIINHEYTLARKDGIEFSTSILVPTSLPFHNGHLSIILGNLLENAIEACRKVTTGQRFIRLNLFYSKEVLQLNLQNSCPLIRKKDNTGHYITTKNDVIHHGLGLSSVRQAVANYDGEVDINDMGKEFQVVVIMYNTFKDTEK